MPALAAALALPPAGRRAHAHAVVLASEPAPDSRLPPGPATVRLRFNSRIDHARCRLVAIGPDGAEVPLAPAPPPGAEPVVLAARTPPLTPGAWRLRWQVLALDGHITRGDIRFTVVPPTAP
ncbi:copper resistance CopC family protein [Caldovatus aquaticus]|uniref:Copper resistance protein CopC n=1 Tax=Caldovatus aquaticus TaxID=2865671 RepID=A0ABS7F261_9PROT|nr:copper resistance protein CopC [Caldovatus aquaticus]